MKKLFAVVVLALSMASVSAIAANASDGTKGNGGAGVSNIENQTKIFEGTTHGKDRAEWSKGRHVDACDSITNWNPAFSRGTTPTPCVKK